MIAFTGVIHCKGLCTERDFSAKTAMLTTVKLFLSTGSGIHGDFFRFTWDKKHFSPLESIWLDQECLGTSTHTCPDTNCARWTFDMLFHYRDA